MSNMFEGILFLLFSLMLPGNIYTKKNRSIYTRFIHDYGDPRNKEKKLLYNC